MNDKYAIGWYSKLTNAMGVGETALPFAECARLCKQANADTPGLEHFPVNVTTKEPIFDFKK